MAIPRGDPLYTTEDPPPIGDIPDPMTIAPGRAAPAPDVAPDQQAPGGWRTNVIPGNMASLAGTPISFAPDGTPELPRWDDSLVRILTADRDTPLTADEKEQALPDLPADPNLEGGFLSPFSGKTIPTPKVNEHLAQLDQDRKVNADDALAQFRPRQAVPQIGQTPQTPETIMRHAIGAFSNPLMLMALVGGAMTRQGARGALAAATGVMQGLNEKDFQKAYLEQHKFRNSVKETALEAGRQTAAVDAELNSGNDPTVMLGNLSALGAQFNDPNLTRLAQQGNLGEIQKYNDGYKKSLDGLHRSTRQYGKAQERLGQYSTKSQRDRERRFEEEASDERAQAVANYKEPPNENNQVLMQKVRKINPDYSTAEWEKRKAGERAAGVVTGRQEAQKPDLDPDAIRMYGRALAGGNVGILRAIPGTGPTGNANRVAVLNAAAREYTQKAEEARARGDEEGARKAESGFNRMTTAFQAGLAGTRTGAQIITRLVQAQEQAKNTAGRVLETSEKVNRTKFPDLNSIFLEAKKKVGNEEVIKFNIALETFVANYANAMSARGQATTDLARRHAYDMISTTFSKGQTRAAIDQMMKELDSEIYGAQQGWGTIVDLFANPFETVGARPATTTPAATPSLEGWH